MTKNIDLQHASYKTIWALAWPVTIGQVLQTTFVIVDLKFIAMLGTDEAAAAAVSSSISWTLFSMMIMISAGTTAIVSRRVGENRREDAGFALVQALILAVIMGSLVGALGLTFSHEILSIFGTTARVAAHAELYMSITFMSTPVLVLGMVLTAAYQAAGDTKRPMQLFALANVINLICDPIMMFGYFGFPALGIRGAALATWLAEFVAVTVLFALLYTRKSPLPMPRLRDSRLDRKLLLQLIRIGFPSGVQETARPLTGNVTFKVIALYGTDALAAFGFGMRALSFCWLFMSGFVVATSALVGQSLGAKLADQAEKIVRKSLLVVSLIAISFFALYGFFGQYVIMIFSSEANVIRIGASYLLIISLGTVFTAPGSVCQAAFTGSGDTRPPMIISLVSNWALKLPMAVVCAYVFHLPIEWIWWAVSLSMILEGGVMWLWFKRGSWKKKEI